MCAALYAEANRSTPVGASSETLVIGVGNDDRGDDAFGLMVARHIASRAIPGVTVLTEQREGTALVSAWEQSSASVFILIDAMSSGTEPGKVVRLEVEAQNFTTRDFLASTHGIGVEQAIELARALGVLPPRLVLYLVEGEQYELGAGLSVAVEAAIRPVCDAVCREIQYGYPCETS